MLFNKTEKLNQKMLEVPCNKYSKKNVFNLAVLL